MPTARLAVVSDLPLLLTPFAASEVSRAVKPREEAQRIWRETMAHPGVYIFVSDEGDRIAVASMLVTAPNHLRGRRSRGFLENVVTHAELQGRGRGRAVASAALARAWASGCHHVLTQSGRADPRVDALYERLGFVPGLRLAYVAKRPWPVIGE
jgi:GNAT superfamily N-acetyltransferase